MTQEEWEAYVTNNVTNNYIAQELVDVERIDMDFYDEGGIVTKSVYYDICPYGFVQQGKIVSMGHTLVRYSENKILNVAAGGGIGYMGNIREKFENYIF